MQRVTPKSIKDATPTSQLVMKMASYCLDSPAFSTRSRANPGDSPSSSSTLHIAHEPACIPPWVGCMTVKSRLCHAHSDISADIQRANCSPSCHLSKGPENPAVSQKKV